MLHMDFDLSNIETIHGFTSAFVPIYYATSDSFGFPSRSKRQTLEIPNFLVTKLNNQDKKMNSSELMKMEY